MKKYKFDNNGNWEQSKKFPGLDKKWYIAMKNSQLKKRDI